MTSIELTYSAGYSEPRRPSDIGREGFIAQGVCNGRWFGYQITREDDSPPRFSYYVTGAPEGELRSISGRGCPLLCDTMSMVVQAIDIVTMPSGAPSPAARGVTFPTFSRKMQRLS